SAPPRVAPKQNRIECETQARRGGGEEPPECTYEYMRRHRSRQRSIAPWIALKASLFSSE
ncbi:MAG: hypothetical protein AAFP04_16335, partial [Myxococcota bacterium]